MTADEMQELDSLNSERVTLVKTKTEMETALRQRRLYEGGRMLDARTYNIRRNTTSRRLGECTVRLIEVNARLKELRRKRNEDLVAARGIDSRDPITLIGHAFNLLHRLACDGVDLDPQEQAVVDALRHYLAHIRNDG